jgi:putative transcriptional regulator
MKRIMLSKLVIAIFLVNAFVAMEWGWAQVRSVERPFRRGPQREITKGVFLVADPRLLDPNFKNTVVLVIDHGHDGTLGVIVNRPTSTLLTQLLPGIKEFQGQSDTLYIGGPVSQQVLLLLFRSPAPPESLTPVLDDIYFSQDMNMLTDTLKKNGRKAAFRIYAGYAGWASGQLQGEFDRGDWRIIRADSGTVFGKDPETVWPEMIRRSSEQLIRRMSGPSLPDIRSNSGR